MRPYFVLAFCLQLILYSCSNATVPGYYQGTYDSNDPAHPFGNVVINISESGNGSCTINFTADGYPNIELTGVDVTSQEYYFITTYYFDYDDYANYISLSGSMEMSGSSVSLWYNYSISTHHYFLHMEAHE